MSLLLFISGIAGLGRGGINYIPWNIYTYIADVDEVVTGQRREGIFAGIMTLTRKASQAGAVMLLLAVTYPTTLGSRMLKRRVGFLLLGFALTLIITIMAAIAA